MKKSLVYFMKPVGMDGPIKIGCSGAVEDRLLSLAIWSPFPLEIIGTVQGTMADEHFLHDCFSGQHSHHEWFLSSPHLRDIIDLIVSAGTVDVARERLTPVGCLRGNNHGRKWTESMRRRMSYSSRIRHVQSQVRKEVGENAPWHAPDDVDAIIERWYRTRKTPPAADIGRLDQYLADPIAHSVVPSWLRMRKAA